MSNSIADQEKAFYASYLGLTDAQVAALSLDDIYSLFLAAPPLGTIAAGPVQLTGAFDLMAIGTVFADLAGASLAIPASQTRPIIIRCKVTFSVATGTSAIAANITPQVRMLDGSSNVLSYISHTFIQVTAANISEQAGQTLEGILLPPVAAQTVKLQGRIRNAAPANWTSANWLPNAGGGGPENLVATYG